MRCARLDLVDLGAEEGERLSHHGARPHPTEIRDADALERQRARTHRRRRSRRTRRGDRPAQDFFGVLAEQRRGTPRPAGTRGKTERRAEVAHAAEPRVFDFDEMAARAQVRLLDGFLHGEDGRDRRAGRLTLFHDLPLAVLHRPFFDERVDHVGVLGAREHVLEHLGLRPVGIAHHLADAVPLPRLERQHPDVAVLAGQDRRGSAERHADAGAVFPLPVLRQRADVLPADEDRGDRLGARDVEMLSSPRAPAPERGCESPRGPGRRAEELGREGPVLERRFARVARSSDDRPR